MTAGDKNLPPPGSGSDYRSLGLILTAVGEMVVPVALGAWLDGRFGWSPWGVAVGAVVGVVGGVGHLVLIARREDRRPPA